MSTPGRRCRGKLSRPGYFEIDVTVELHAGTGTLASRTAKYELDGSYVLSLEDGQVLVVNVVAAMQVSDGIRARFTVEQES